ncbi:MAG TPA: PRC-barrel domain-containing protein [Anaerolineae bacterium]|nr:PRC-barrel domain-containing protein [Anaerolineae bacterium]
MARYEFMKGLPVITMAEGKQIGKIDDLIVDPERKVVGWLRLHSGGMLGGERLWVSTEAVHGVGEDAVTINAEADARAPADAPDALALVKAKRGVIGNTVITEKGERVGEVRDYEFDPDTFALTSLSVPPGMNVVGEILMIPGDKVLTIGKDMIVVAADATMRPEVMAEVGNALAL